MKIHGPNHTNFNPYQKQINQQNGLKNSSKQQQDKVEISDQGKALQDAGKTSEERQKYIDEIKAQVDDGSYKVDSKQAAKNLVDFFTDDRGE
ncbi:negative regulator of flagellin synthesis [Halobacillus andaensis]|uniref:Negative regulator of flagellin synthesis n=1 Tax=Halobacillus andaensis TaxID=1176239 RepID=A0A917B8J9_HALAA|nr:flagellar biosynthesis anti-sigma factor FlgM [Halobacillus andaensis]MBP2005409.1 negative regulator of flagellin synthesis FlgM [Halobacillus andaensis]GGF31237.1 negative regulator of flagellin synthesis [Halobacillus andaensis]